MGTDELSAILRRLRTDRGLSQQAVASRAGLSRNFVAQIERGESVPTVATLSRIAVALGVAVGELLGEPPLAAADSDAVGVPLVADRIAAGPPLLIADHVDRIEPLPRSLLRSLPCWSASAPTRTPWRIRSHPDPPCCSTAHRGARSPHAASTQCARRPWATPGAR